MARSTNSSSYGPKTFTVVLKKAGDPNSAANSLGIDVNHADSVTLLVEGITSTEGLVATWNRQNPKCELKSGDRITHVNGVTGDALAMIEQCRVSSVLELKCTRPGAY